MFVPVLTLPAAVADSFDIAAQPSRHRHSAPHHGRVARRTAVYLRSCTVTHDGNVGATGAIAETDEKAGSKAPRRRGLRTGVTFRNVNDRNHSAGGINTIVTSH